MGYYFDPTTSLYHGFLDDGGIFTPINDPEGSDTQAWGINNNGEIVGTFFDTAMQANEGFLDDAGSFTTIDNVPGALSTTITGINDSGEMVGIYSGCCSGGEQAFFFGPPVPPPPTPTTPLPAALPLFVTGLGVMGLFGWRRKQKPKAAV